jgi:hypothetical protein
MDPSYNAVQRPPLYEKYIKPTLDAISDSAMFHDWDWNASGGGAVYKLNPADP